MSMTDEQLAEIRWRYEETNRHGGLAAYYATQRFHEHAEEDMELLLAEVDRLTAELAERGKARGRRKAKGPKSKPNQLRARIKKEARRVGGQWHTDGESCVILRFDGVEARGYSYCNPADVFAFRIGEPLARRRAYEALESAMKDKPTVTEDELVSKRGSATLWSWQRVVARRNYGEWRCGRRWPK